MKRQALLATLLLLAATFSVQPLVAQEKLFQEAIARGHADGQFYEARNDKGKGISPEKMKQFAQQQGYLIGNLTVRTVDKFGDKATAINTFEFLPANEYPAYVYATTKDAQAPQYGQLGQLPKGTCYVYYTDKFVRLDNVCWSGRVENGMLSGMGYGFVSQMSGTNSGTFCYVQGSFQDGLPQGVCLLRTVPVNPASNNIMKVQDSGRYSVNVGNVSDGMATFNVGNDPKVGFVQSNGAVTLQPTYNPADILGSFKNGRIAVKNEKKESIYVDSNGKYIDYTETQKQVFAAAQAREDSIKAAEARARYLAEQKAAEEKRLAEEREADLRRRIEKNKNTRLWTLGCRLAYRYPNGREYVIATLEEWNENRTRAKVKIVASPTSTGTLNGDLLAKNNTMWISTTNEGWHLALDEEIAIALRRDDSANDHICHSCNGRGTVPCYRCNGTGVEDTWNHYTCQVCKGKGSTRCDSCGGSGRK